MTLSALGIFSAAGAGEVAGGAAYELITSTILSSSQPSVTFSSLGTYSSTYKHFQIRLTAKDNRAVNSSRFYIRVNAATSNYLTHSLYGDGSTAGSGAGYTDRIVIQGSTGNTATNIYGTAVIDLFDAFATKNKTFRSFSGLLVSGYTVLEVISGTWFDTATLSSITIGGDFGDLLAGSRFSLYGIKG